MNFGDYLQGSIELIAVAAAMGFAAVGLRGRLLPGWSGASARLAEVVLGLALLIVTLELVGVVGLYRPGWVLLASLIVGLGIGFALRTPRPGPPLWAPQVTPIALGVAVAAAFLVAAHWAMPTQTGLDIGMYLPNTTWQNAPFAARFVQDHQVGALHFTEVLNLTVWFYPQNSELLHSSGILFLGNDFLSPFLNIGWMALCLLAAWAFARAYGGGPIAVLAMALVLDANMLLLYQPGDAKNDTMGLFFFLASAAILVNADAQRRAAHEAQPADRGTVALPNGALIVAGLAAGVALGTKLNLLAPFGLLTLGVIAVSAGYRWRATGIWVVSSLITGGFWFARNLINAGNPLPWIKAGPLVGPDQADINIREPHNVAHYLLPPDGGVIRHHLIPGLHDSFGDLWPLVLIAVIGGFLLAIFRGRTSMIRMLGIVALLSGLAYLVTPLTAAGPQGDPTAFTTNLRYSSPALGLGAMLLGVDAGLLKPRVQPWLIGALVVLLLVQAVPVWDLHGHLWTRHFLRRSDRPGDLPDPRPGRTRDRPPARRLSRLCRCCGRGRARPCRRDRLGQEQGLRQGPLSGIDGASRLPGRHEGCARLVQPRGPARLAGSPSSAAVPASSSTSSTATTSPTTSSTWRGTVRTAPICQSQARRHNTSREGPPSSPSARNGSGPSTRVATTMR